MSWMKISQLDAGSFDDETCYAAVDTMRIDDWKPHLFKTHDGGKTWTRLMARIPEGEVTRTIREDPVRKGLLYCGTERSVWFSIDDGGHWRHLRLNMPATSIRDLVVVKDDLAVGTHGRGFWILDDVTPLRQLSVGNGKRFCSNRRTLILSNGIETRTRLFRPKSQRARTHPTGRF